MAEETKPADEKAADEAAHPVLHQAKKGVIDADEIVTSAAGEPLSGIIADITDGDRHVDHHHHKK